MGKRDRDVLYEGKQREREKGTQPNLRVHLSGGSSLSNCPCSTSCIKEAFNELEAPAITLHLPPSDVNTRLFVDSVTKCVNCTLPKQILFFQPLLHV